ncbi:hypothetical protein BDV24DRAFT_130930 [Aspergillus arachidicola]|uniref:Uncharacterized protein n=1 Tax=Aspergillus arachidicola TaxID=656916 RepID=A0A5N6Y9G0_9EURO|nr:hypothetical protein BDV24DRAFT_130930 [Aspergillus arachidicola]
MRRKVKDGTTCKTFGIQSQVPFPGMDGQLMIVMMTLWPSSKKLRKTGLKSMVGREGEDFEKQTQWVEDT